MAAEEVRLSDEQRDALFAELAAHQRATAPDAHHCFCGSDQDLVDVVQRIRADRERE